jgi:hypothetical protein
MSSINSLHARPESRLTTACWATLTIGVALAGVTMVGVMMLKKAQEYSPYRPGYFTPEMAKYAYGEYIRLRRVGNAMLGVGLGGLIIGGTISFACWWTGGLRPDPNAAANAARKADVAARRGQWTQQTEQLQALTSYLTEIQEGADEKQVRQLKALLHPLQKISTDLAALPKRFPDASVGIPARELASAAKRVHTEVTGLRETLREIFPYGAPQRDRLNRICTEASLSHTHHVERAREPKRQKARRTDSD